jgi:uncharacterized protein (DUF2249 family)
MENILDVRPIAPKDKHEKIFSMFYNLESGQKMEIINDHNPKPLHYQLLAENEGQFEWKYLEEGPEVWRVEILRK